MESIFIAISSICAILATSISLLLTYKTTKHISERIEEAKTKAVLSYQRERQENLVYDAQERLLSTPVRFTESNHLFLSYNGSLHLSNAIRDNSFFQNLGIDSTQLRVKPNKVMCLMPFHERFNKTRNHIQDACEKEGFTFVRSDDQFETGNLLRQIVRHILEAQVIVALLDGKSPNVTYEIGIANALGKPVILIAKMSQKNEIPEDLRPERLVLYKTMVDMKKTLRKILKKLHENG